MFSQPGSLQSYCAVLLRQPWTVSRLG